MEGQNPAYGCKIAPTVSSGTILKDTRQKKWRIVKPIGSGGFGAVYSASPKGFEGEPEYIVKVEPFSNGPLFVEMHAFFRVCQESCMVEWKPRNKKMPQGWVGIPKLQGAGSAVLKDERIRFLVMDRLGCDIERFFKSGERLIPLPTALNIAVQIIDTLEYVHSKNYCHNDIKAQNILLGPHQDENVVYLVDFGLACKFKDMYGYHCDDLPDDRKAHEGTLIYTSRDAHLGSHSRRGDLETLGFNLIHWTSGYLPWNEIEDPEAVQAHKIAFMAHVESLLEKCFKPDPYPQCLLDFLNYVGQLQFSEAPNYEKLRGILEKAMREEGREPYSKLVFSTKKVKKRHESEEDQPQLANSDRMPEEGVRVTRSQLEEEPRQETWNWESVLWSNPEDIIRQASRSYDDADSINPEKDATYQERDREALLNPTPEMQKILDARATAEESREKLSWKDQLMDYNQRQAQAKAKWANMDLTPSDTTPAMQEVMDKMAKRMASGISSPMTPEPSDVEEEVIDKDTADSDADHDSEMEVDGMSDSDTEDDVEPGSSKASGRGALLSSNHRPMRKSKWEALKRNLLKRRRAASLEDIVEECAEELGTPYSARRLRNLRSRMVDPETPSTPYSAPASCTTSPASSEASPSGDNSRNATPEPMNYPMRTRSRTSSRNSSPAADTDEEPTPGTRKSKRQRHPKSCPCGSPVCGNSSHPGRKRSQSCSEGSSSSENGGVSSTSRKAATNKLTKKSSSVPNSPQRSSSIHTNISENLSPVAPFGKLNRMMTKHNTPMIGQEQEIMIDKSSDDSKSCTTPLAPRQTRLMRLKKDVEPVRGALSEMWPDNGQKDGGNKQPRRIHPATSRLMSDSDDESGLPASESKARQESPVRRRQTRSQSVKTAAKTAKAKARVQVSLESPTRIYNSPKIDQSKHSPQKRNLRCRPRKGLVL